MSVSDGQDVSAAVTNAAFMSRTQNTGTTGAVDITNTTESTDNDSGALIVDGGAAVKGRLNAGGEFATISQTVSTNGTIVQLSSSNSFVRLTGTAPEVQGIAAGTDGQHITIHNVSGGTVTIYNQDGSATAADRIITGTGADVSLDDTKSIEFIYDATQSRWVSKSSSTSPSSGGGSKNYIDNDGFESGTDGVSTYDDTGAYVDGTGGSPSAITISTTTTAGQVLAGTQSLVISKAASDASGEGVSILSETIDRVDRGKVLNGSFAIDATNANYTSQDLVVHAYDVTNSVELDVQRGEGGVGIPAITQTFNFKVLTNSDTAQIRLSLHLESDSATGSAWSIYLDEVKLGPEEKIVGLAGSDWETYSLTIGATTTPPTKATTTIVDSAKWRRVGPNMELSYEYYHTDNTGSAAGTGTYLFPLPSGYEIDSTLVNVSATFDSRDTLKSNVFVNSPGTSDELQGFVQAYDASNLVLVVHGSSTDPRQVSEIASGYFPINTASIRYSVKVTVPIAGWTAGVTLSQDKPFRISSIIANGTRVTTTPSAYGEWRSQLRNSSANTFTDTNGTPGSLPSSSDGMLLYSGNGWGSADSNNEPSKYEIFVGQNKHLSWEFYTSTGRTGVVTPDMLLVSTIGVGCITGYDPTTGVASITQYATPSATSAGIFGYDANSAGGTTDGYFDIWVSSDPNPAQVNSTRDELYVVAGASAGYGSTNTKVIYMNATPTVNTGDAMTWNDDSTNGSSITINYSDFYTLSIAMNPDSSADMRYGFSVDSSELTTDFDAITDSNKAVRARSTTNNELNSVTRRMWLEKGQVVRPHADADSFNKGSSAAAGWLSISRG